MQSKIRNELLKDSKKNDKRPVSWNAEIIACKAELTNAILLAHPIEGAMLFFSTVSDTVIGASLEQMSNVTYSIRKFQ